MPSDQDIIITGRDDVIHALCKLWDHPESYPELFDHFSATELAKINALKTKVHCTAADGLFMHLMVGKLLFHAEAH